MSQAGWVIPLATGGRDVGGIRAYPGDTFFGRLDPHSFRDTSSTRRLVNRIIRN